jgi:hypothetical protein
MDPLEEAKLELEKWNKRREKEEEIRLRIFNRLEKLTKLAEAEGKSDKKKSKSNDSSDSSSVELVLENAEVFEDKNKPSSSRSKKRSGSPIDNNPKKSTIRPRARSQSEPADPEKVNNQQQRPTPPKPELISKSFASRARANIRKRYPGIIRFHCNYPGCDASCCRVAKDRFKMCDYFNSKGCNRTGNHETETGQPLTHCCHVCFNVLGIKMDHSARCHSCPCRRHGKTDRR